MPRAAVVAKPVPRSRDRNRTTGADVNGMAATQPPSARPRRRATTGASPIAIGVMVSLSARSIWPSWRVAYTDRVIAVIVFIILALGIGAALWWGGTLPRTRPRPGSRGGAEPYVAGHRKFEQRKRR